MDAGVAPRSHLSSRVSSRVLRGQGNFCRTAGTRRRQLLGNRFGLEGEFWLAEGEGQEQPAASPSPRVDV